MSTVIARGGSITNNALQAKATFHLRRHNYILTCFIKDEDCTTMAPNYESDELESGSEDESVEEEVVVKKRSKKAWKVRVIMFRRGCCHPDCLVYLSPIVIFSIMLGSQQA